MCKKQAIYQGQEGKAENISGLICTGGTLRARLHTDAGGGCLFSKHSHKLLVTLTTNTPVCVIVGENVIRNSDRTSVLSMKLAGRNIKYLYSPLPYRNRFIRLAMTHQLCENTSLGVDFEE